MIRRLLTMLCSLAAGGVLLAAQGTGAPPAGPPQSPQQPVFRARVDSITVDVTVTDKQGRPVLDLTAEDFEVRESNKVQTIDAFRLIAPDILDDNDAGRTRSVLSLADHRRETEDPENRLYVLFLDDYHVRRGNSIRIREELARFVSQLSPRDLVAVLYPMTPIAAATFSRDHDGTATAIRKFEGRKYDYTPTNDYERQVANWPPETLEQMRNELTIRALSSACVYLGSLREGRKAIVFVSEGMTATMPQGARTTGSLRPVVGSDNSTSQAWFATADLMGRMRDIFSSASRSNTSIFTLDPRGLSTSEFGLESRVDFESDRRLLNDALDSLRTIADETDGRAIVGRNNPVLELQKVVREMSAYYLLGYTSSVAPRDGKFHPIQVRVKRRDVEVRARKGYWAYTEDEARLASAPPRMGPPSDVSNALEELAGVVEPASRRAVTVWLGAARGADEKARVTLAWEAQGAPAQDPMDRVARISVNATSGGGDVLFNGAVPPEAAARLAGRVTFDAPAGLVRLRVTTENDKGQRLDTEDLSYEVPDFTGAQPMISTPTVFRGRTARDIAQLRTSPAALPAATRQFSRTERLLVRFDAYGPAGTAPKVSMRLLNRLGESIIPLPDPVAAASSAVTFESEITLGALPPGDYLIEISAAAATETTKKLLGIRVTG